MPKIQIDIPMDVHRKMREEVSAGVYPTIKAVVSDTLRKAYAVKSREFLRRLAAREKISETAMLKALAELRS